MQHSTQLVLALFGGALGGLITLPIPHLMPRYARHFLAAVLIVVALIYVGFAVGAHESSSWLLVELLGVAVYSAMALRGVHGSPWWLVAGWALHPVWDIPLHYFGPGHTFMPSWYTVGCLSWDWVVAGYLVWRVRQDARATISAAR